MLHELIKQLCDESLSSGDIQVQLVLPDGKEEMGHDEGGVLRNCLSFGRNFTTSAQWAMLSRCPFFAMTSGSHSGKVLDEFLHMVGRKTNTFQYKLLL